MLILVVGISGFVVDTLQASAGLYAFSGTSILPWLCPPWMVSLLFDVGENAALDRRPEHLVGTDACTS